MESSAVQTILAQYGLAGLFAVIIGWVLYRVGLRLIAALDRLVAKLDEHTTTDVEWHGRVERSIVALQSRVDTIAELTPVEIPFGRKPTPPPGAVYSIHRPRTRGGNNDDEK